MAEWKKVVTESSAGTISQNTTGTSSHSSTADALETARTISLSGDVTGSATFSGAANANIAASIAANSVTATELALASNGTAGQVLASDGDGTFSWVDAGAGGTVTSVTAGNGLSFTEITTSGSVTLGTPSSLTVSGDNSVTATSHTHRVMSSANPGASASILATTATGTLTLAGLTVTGDLAVQGSLTSIETTNLRVTDTVVQLNSLADGTAYSDSESAVILGNSTQAHGGKIINTDAYIAFTSLHADDMGAGALPAGTTTAGSMKQIRALDVVLSTQGALPAGIAGQIAFDGADLYVYV